MRYLVRMLEDLRWKLVFCLLSPNERSVIASTVREADQYAMSRYANCMGETIEEFRDEVSMAAYRIKNW